MNRDILKLINCPARDCGSHLLSLEEQRVDMMTYRVGRVEEVREGAIICQTCGRSYPIQDYVPSFEQLFPQDLRDEAQYWSDWYGFFWERGYTGFFDLRSPTAHLIARGIEVSDPRSLSGEDLEGTHTALADHPAISSAERILDVGCGCGWSSLYLARRRHTVIAFDPSGDNVRRAKLYAISKGEYIEYMAAALGYLSFQPEVFDAVFALHSIHHVPNLRSEILVLRNWLREGGAIAVDEHVQNDSTLLAVSTEIEKWFQKEIAPRFTTLSLDKLQGLPRDAHSSLEGAGSTDVVGAITDNFSVQTFKSRYVSLDIFSFLYYLWRDRDVDAYAYAAEIVAQLYDFMQRAHPESAEYVTLVACKSDTKGPATPDLAHAMLAILGPDSSSGVLSGMHGEVVAQLMKEVEDLKVALADSTTAIATLQDTVNSLNQSANTLQDTVDSLNQTAYNKNKHIAHLEAAFARQDRELANKQAALDNHVQLLERVEQGRVLRVLNTMTRKKTGKIRRPPSRVPRPLS